MTPFTDIYEYAHADFGDYRIKKLYNTDLDAYNTYMYSLLIRGLGIISGISDSVYEYTSQEETDSDDGETHTVYYFTGDLTYKEKEILSKAMNVQWAIRLVQDITAYSSLPEKDFSKVQAVELFKQKENHKDELMQELYQLINDYQLKNISSSSTATNIFGG